MGGTEGHNWIDFDIAVTSLLLDYGKVVIQIFFF